MNYNQIAGRNGENEAAKYLEDLGYEIICKNFRCMNGEIDIIAKDGNEYVFVEVKTRTNRSYGEGRDAVDNNKQKHIKKAAKYFIYKNGLESAFIRMDVIEIYLKNGINILNHIKQAIE